MCLLNQGLSWDGLFLPRPNRDTILKNSRGGGCGAKAVAVL